MKKLYVKAASKRDLNEKLKTGQVIGYEHKVDGVDSYRLDCLKEKTLIVIYQKRVNGNPFGISYGEYDPAKNAVK